MRPSGPAAGYSASNGPAMRSGRCPMKRSSSSSTIEQSWRGRIDVGGNSEAADRSRLRLVEWRPMVKNTLRDFVSTELPNGLTIREMPVLVGKNGPWVSLPAKPQIDGGGQVRRDPNGKIAYTAILNWRSKDLADRFSRAVVDLLLTHHPRALSGDAAP